jgi:hypothetical protein
VVREALPHLLSMEENIMKQLPIKCKDKTDQTCLGFRGQPGFRVSKKEFCKFEINSFCGADGRDFKLSEEDINGTRMQEVSRDS